MPSYTRTRGQKSAKIAGLRRAKEKRLRGKVKRARATGKRHSLNQMPRGGTRTTR